MLDLLKKYWWQALAVIVAVCIFAWLISRLFVLRTDDTDSVIDNLPKEDIMLTYYRWQDDGETLREIAERYNDKHPNITIVIRYVDEFNKSTRLDPRYDYRDYIVEQIANKKGPDIFSINNEWLPYINKQIYPMPDKFMNIDEYENNFTSVAIDDFTLNREVYAIPYFTDNLILFYNPQIMRQAGIFTMPKTWQDVSNMVPRLTKLSSSGDLISSAINLGLDHNSIPRFAEIVATLMMQNGGVMLSPDNRKATFNLPLPGSNPPFYPAQEAVELYTSFADRKSANFTYANDLNLDGSRRFPSDVQAFGEEKMAMLIHYGHIGEWLEKFYPNLDFKVAVLPQVREAVPITLAKYWGETVSKDSKYPEVAWDFINFVSKESNIKFLADATNRIPAKQDLWPKYANDFYKPIVKQAKFATSWYRFDPENVTDIFAEMINNVLQHGLSPAIAIEAAIQKM